MMTSVRYRYPCFGGVLWCVAGWCLCLPSGDKRYPEGRAQQVGADGTIVSCAFAWTCIRICIDTSWNLSRAPFSLAFAVVISYELSYDM